jgi:serine/threonine protein phosphatase 1
MDFVKRIPSNKDGKDFIVGDLHGCYDMLMDALKAIDFDYEADRLFSVGDLVDRGPKSAECLGLIKEPWFHTVRGNHEVMMLYAAKDSGMARMWCGNGGRWAQDFPDGTLHVWRKQIEQLPGVIVVGEGADRFNVLHAEPEFPRGAELISNAAIDSTEGPENEDPEDRDLYWGRSFLHSHRNIPPFEDLSVTYVGHTSTTGLIRLGPIIYLDRGAVYRCNSCCLAIACHTNGVVHEYFPDSGELLTTYQSDIEDVSPQVPS